MFSKKMQSIVPLEMFEFFLDLMKMDVDVSPISYRQASLANSWGTEQTRHCWTATKTSPQVTHLGIHTYIHRYSYTHKYCCWNGQMCFSKQEVMKQRSERFLLIQLSLIKCINNLNDNIKHRLLQIHTQCSQWMRLCHKLSLVSLSVHSWVYRVAQDDAHLCTHSCLLQRAVLLLVVHASRNTWRRRQTDSQTTGDISPVGSQACMSNTTMWNWHLLLAMSGLQLLALRYSVEQSETITLQVTRQSANKRQRRREIVGSCEHKCKHCRYANVLW